MKKRISVIFLVFLLVAACSQQTISEKHVEETEPPVKEQDNNSDISKTVSEPKEEVQDTMTEERSPQYKLNPANWAIEPIKDANPKVALLTFDDAPDQHALEIANQLHALQVPAIFFVNGHFLESEEGKAVLTEIDRLGFEIGNHTNSHSNLKELTEEKQREEIILLNDKIETIIGERPKFFRAPFGANTEYSKQAALEENMLVMNWTFGYDWEKEYQNKDLLTNITLESPYLANGANILMHDREWTSEAIEGIVIGLQKQGYQLVDPALIETPGK
jgi:peptidoglycan/xylan/chitin deacetylase (PgdA/CDA1 family)